MKKITLLILLYYFIFTKNVFAPPPPPGGTPPSGTEVPIDSDILILLSAAVLFTFYKINTKNLNTL